MFRFSMDHISMFSKQRLHSVDHETARPTRRSFFSFFRPTGVNIFRKGREGSSRRSNSSQRRERMQKKKALIKRSSMSILTVTLPIKFQGVSNSAWTKEDDVGHGKDASVGKLTGVKTV